MHDNTKALPDRTKAILSCDVIVSRVGRRVRSPGVVLERVHDHHGYFIFRPHDGGPDWAFSPVNSIAGHAITVDEFVRSLRSRGFIEALWDEIEGHPVIMISIMPDDPTLEGRDPLIIAKRLALSAGC